MKWNELNLGNRSTEMLWPLTTISVNYLPEKKNNIFSRSIELTIAFDSYLYCWSSCAFSILLSLARRFWNHILICVSVRLRRSASSTLLILVMYSVRWYSISSLRVWSLVKVVLCRRCLVSFRLRRLTGVRDNTKTTLIFKGFGPFLNDTEHNVH